MKLTIQRIADLAGVSKGSVSKALNGQKGIGEETRTRILRLVQELDFQPDSSARALALQRTGTIGLLIPHSVDASMSGQYWGSVLAGIGRRASRAGLKVLVLNAPEEGDVRGALNPVLRRRTVDGLVLGGDLIDKPSLSTLVLHNLPFVLFGRNPEFTHYCVDIDSDQGTTLLVNHMIDQGYRRIGAIFGPETYAYVPERRDAYRRVLRDRGVSWSAEAHTPYVSPSIRATLAGLLDRHPDMDALFVGAGGDFLLDCLGVLQDRNVPMPQFGLGVFDDYAFLDILRPKVTAIRQPLVEAGEAALTMLEDLIEGRTPPSPWIKLPTKLVVRQSCSEG